MAPDIVIVRWAEPAFSGPAVIAWTRPSRSRWPPEPASPGSADVEPAAAGSDVDGEPWSAGVSALPAAASSLHAVRVQVATARTASEANACRMRMGAPVVRSSGLHPRPWLDGRDRNGTGRYVDGSARTPRSRGRTGRPRADRAVRRGRLPPRLRGPGRGRRRGGPPGPARAHRVLPWRRRPTARPRPPDLVRRKCIGVPGGTRPRRRRPDLALAGARHPPARP